MKFTTLSGAPGVGFSGTSCHGDTFLPDKSKKYRLNSMVSVVPTGRDTCGGSDTNRQRICETTGVWPASQSMLVGECPDGET